MNCRIVQLKVFDGVVHGDVLVIVKERDIQSSQPGSMESQTGQSGPNIPHLGNAYVKIPIAPGEHLINWTIQLRKAFKILNRDWLIAPICKHQFESSSKISTKSEPDSHLECRGINA